MSVEAIVAPTINISESAQTHFIYLISKEDMPGMGLRIFLDQPGLPKADVSISFCPPGEHRAGDIPVDFGVFTLYVDRASAAYLENADIDYKSDKIGGQLVITVPNLRGTKPTENDSLVEKVNYILHSEVNPSLSSHGGMVTLVEITENNEVVLRFGGGCHGCGMVDVTLKQGIEKAIMSQLPEVTAVIDVTDHSKGENPYYN